MTLTDADRNHIREATGWLELGDYLSAFDALERVEPQHRVHPAVLSLRWRIYAKAERWGNAFTVAEGLTRINPKDVEAFIWRSYAARRMECGSVEQAFELLSDVADDFADEPLVIFNLACYLCQLGRLEEARKRLEQALVAAEKLGQTKRYQQMILDEPDLEPLRNEHSL